MLLPAVLFGISVLFCLMISVSQAANVLYIEGLPSPSHHVWHKTLTYELANKGHNVTVLGVDIEAHNLSTLHYIHLEKVYEVLSTIDDMNDLFATSEKSFVAKLLPGFDFFSMLCEGSYMSNGYKQLVDYPSDFQFDIVIFETLFSPCLLPLVDRFNNPPIIAATAYFGYDNAVDLVGDAFIFPFHQHILSKQFDPKCFISRLTNFFYYFIDRTYRYFVFNSRITELVQKHYGKTVNLFEIERRVQLALVNSDKALDVAQPMATNVIPVGGLQIKKPKPLAEDLEKIFNKAKKGVILFSLGTNVQTSSLGEKRVNEFIKAFKSFEDYEILWKATDIDPSLLPKNVHVLSWIPQNDILANPKTKLFITHSGLLSTQEATKYGVPMLGMPVFFDQFMNTNKNVAKGTAEALLFHNFNSEALRLMMQKILSDPKYKENALVYSKIFLDQKEPPLERAIWWIEWVLRHPHTKVFDHPGKSMSMFQRLSLDVYVFLLSVILIAFKVILFTVRKILKSSSKSMKQSNKMKIN